MSGEPIYRGTICGDYSPATANNRLKTVVVGRRARVVRASAYVAWERSAVLQLRAPALCEWAPGYPARIIEAPCRVEVDVWHPVQHRKGPAAGLARIDVDALAKSTLDALVAAGVLLDDTLVVELTSRKHIADKAQQRIDVRVWLVS